MENLIPIINKLQDTFASVGLPGLDLPQIAVVGSQSSGKSSVLESIVGRDFLPRGSGIVTRRPLVLQLIHTPGTQEYGTFLHQPDRKYESFAAIRSEIQAETDRTTGSNKGISASPINLKIYSPNVIDLTLIDLPGVTKIAVGDQPADIEALIRNMVMDYIGRESCLILAVSPANADLANSDALQLAHQVDPEGNRTIAVLTKLDLMDEGTHAMDILTNKTYPLKHGFVGVVNRSQKDIDANKDVSSAISKENEWFAKHPQYKQIKTACGTMFLREKLRTTLMYHIQRHLPALKQRLHSRLEVVKKELGSLNSPFLALDPTLGFDESALRDASVKSMADFQSDPLAMQRILLHIINQFGSTVKSIIDGHDGDIGNDNFDCLSFITGSALNVMDNKENNRVEAQVGQRSAKGFHRSLVELNSSVRIKYLFAESFPKTLSSLEDILLSSDMDNEIRAIIHNTRGLRAGLFVPDAVMEILIKRHILQLESPALQCVDSVWDELKRMVQMILCGIATPVASFPALRDWMIKTTMDFLETCRQPTVAEVKRLIRMEISYINTSHPDFIGRNGITQWYMDQQRVHLNVKREELHEHSSSVGHKSGWLMKLGGTRKNWKKRWFVLKDARLVFFEREDGQEEKGSFSLFGCSVRDLATGKVYPDVTSTSSHKARKSAGEQSEDKDKARLFEIFCEDGSHLFRNHQSLFLLAENDKEKSAWMRLLCDSIIWARDEEKSRRRSLQVSDDVDVTAVVPPSDALTPPDSPGSRDKLKLNMKPKPSSVDGMLSPLPDKLYASHLYEAKNRQIAAENGEGAEGLSGSDDFSISLVRILLHSYFRIVRKHIQDLVPKAIMYMMIGRLKKDLASILSNSVLSAGKDKDGKEGQVNVLDLLEEDETIREERKNKMTMIQLVEKALHVLDTETRAI